MGSNELEQNIDDVLSSILMENAKETSSNQTEVIAMKRHFSNNQLKIKAMPALITAVDELTQTKHAKREVPASPNIYYDLLEFEDENEYDDNEINDIFSDEFNDNAAAHEQFEMDLVEYDVDLSLFPKESECFPSP